MVNIDSYLPHKHKLFGVLNGVLRPKSLRTAAVGSVCLHFPTTQLCSAWWKEKEKIAEGALGRLASALGKGLSRSALWDCPIVGLLLGGAEPFQGWVLQTICSRPSLQIFPGHQPQQHPEACRR